MLTGGQCQRGPGVPQIVQPNRRQPGMRCFAGERAREPFGVQRPAVRSAEHQAMITKAGAHQHPLSQLAAAMLP
jgi:hypothetical protein